MTNCRKAAPADEAMCAEHRNKYHGLTGDIRRDLVNLAKRVTKLERAQPEQEKT